MSEGYKGNDYSWLQRNQRPLVGLIVVVGVFLMYVLVLVYNPLPAQGDTEKVRFMILGALLGFLIYVLQYLFEKPRDKKRSGNGTR